MNAVLAKPIPHVLVYSSRSIDKALISIKHLLQRGQLHCAAPRDYRRYWTESLELLHCTMSRPSALHLTCDCVPR
jgi:hypothetical protein